MGRLSQDLNWKGMGLDMFVEVDASFWTLSTDIAGMFELEILQGCLEMTGCGRPRLCQ